MNCLAFRRRLYADPYDGDRALRAHREECEPCSLWYARHLSVERRLRQALAFPVPPDLAPRILLRQAFLGSRIRSSSLRRAGALAASFLVGFAVAGLLFWARPDTDLEDDVLRHVDELAYALERNQPIGDAAVVALFDWMGADVRGDLGDVRFANLCTVRGRRVAHLVVAGAEGPVTILVMPEESVHRSLAMEDGIRRGRIAPYRTGALVVVSERPEPIEERVRSLLQWRAVGEQKPAGSA